MPEKYKLTEEDLQSLMGEDLVVHSKGLPTKETMSHLDKLASGSDQVLTKSEYEKQWHEKSYEWARLAYFDSHYSKGEPSGPFVMKGWVFDNQDVTKSLATAYAPDILSNTSGRVPEEEKVAYRKKLAKKFITPLHLYTKSLDKLIKSTTDSKTQFEDQIDALSSMIYYLDLAISNLESDIHDSADNANDVAQLNHSYNNQAFLYLNRYHPGYFGFSAEHTLQKLKKIREKLVSFQEKNPALNNEAIQAHSSIYQRGGAYEKIAEAGDQYHATYFSRNKNTQPQPIDKNTAQKNIYRFIIEMLEGKIPYDESHLRQNALIAIHNHHDLIITSIKRSPANDIMTARTNLLNLTHFLDMLQSLNKAGLTEHTQANLGSFVLPVNFLVSKYPDPAIAALKAKINRIIDPPNVLPLQSTSSVSSPTSSSSSSEDAQSVKIEQAISSMKGSIADIITRLGRGNIIFKEPEDENSAVSFEITPKTDVRELPSQADIEEIIKQLETASEAFKGATKGVVDNPEVEEAGRRLRDLQTALTGFATDIKDFIVGVRNKLRDQKRTEKAAKEPIDTKESADFSLALQGASVSAQPPIDLFKKWIALQDARLADIAKKIPNSIYIFNTGELTLEKEHVLDQASATAVVAAIDEMRQAVEKDGQAILRFLSDANSDQGEPIVRLLIDFINRVGMFNSSLLGLLALYQANQTNLKQDMERAANAIAAAQQALLNLKFQAPRPRLGSTNNRPAIGDTPTSSSDTPITINAALLLDNVDDVDDSDSDSDSITTLSSLNASSLTNDDDDEDEELGIMANMQDLQAIVAEMEVVAGTVNETLSEYEGVDTGMAALRSIIVVGRPQTENSCRLNSVAIGLQLSERLKSGKPVNERSPALTEYLVLLSKINTLVNNNANAFKPFREKYGEEYINNILTTLANGSIQLGGIQVLVEILKELSLYNTNINKIDQLQDKFTQAMMAGKQKDNPFAFTVSKILTASDAILPEDKQKTGLQDNEASTIINGEKNDQFRKIIGLAYKTIDYDYSVDRTVDDLKMELSKSDTLIQITENGHSITLGYSKGKYWKFDSLGSFNTEHPEIKASTLEYFDDINTIDKYLAPVIAKAKNNKAEIHIIRSTKNDLTLSAAPSARTNSSNYGDRVSFEGEPGMNVSDILVQAKNIYNSVNPKDPAQIKKLFDQENGKSALATFSVQADQAIENEFKLIRQLNDMKTNDNSVEIEKAIRTINTYLFDDPDSVLFGEDQRGLKTEMNESNEEIKRRAEIRDRLNKIYTAGLEVQKSIFSSIAFARTMDNPSQSARDEHVQLLTNGIQEIDKQMGLVHSILAEPHMLAMSRAVLVPSGSRGKIGVIDLSFDILKILGKYRDEQRRALVLINRKFALGVIDSIPKGDLLTSMHSTEIQKFIDQLAQAKQSIADLPGTSEIDQPSGYVNLQAKFLNAEKTLGDALLAAKQKEQAQGLGKVMPVKVKIDELSPDDSTNINDAHGLSQFIRKKRLQEIANQNIVNPDDDDAINVGGGWDLDFPDVNQNGNQNDTMINLETRSDAGSETSSDAGDDLVERHEDSVSEAYDANLEMQTGHLDEPKSDDSPIFDAINSALDAASNALQDPDQKDVFGDLQSSPPVEDVNSQRVQALLAAAKSIYNQHIEQVKTAIDRGLNNFDTAYLLRQVDLVSEGLDGYEYGDNDLESLEGLVLNAILRELRQLTGNNSLSHLDINSNVTPVIMVSRYIERLDADKSSLIQEINRRKIDEIMGDALVEYQALYDAYYSVPLKELTLEQCISEFEQLSDEPVGNYHSYYRDMLDVLVPEGSAEEDGPKEEQARDYLLDHETMLTQYGKMHTQYLESLREAIETVHERKAKLTQLYNQMMDISLDHAQIQKNLGNFDALMAQFEQLIDDYPNHLPSLDASQLKTMFVNLEIKRQALNLPTVSVSSEDKQLMESKNIIKILDENGKGAREIYRLNIDALLYMYMFCDEYQRQELFPQLNGQMGHIRITGPDGVPKFSLMLERNINFSPSFVAGINAELIKNLKGYLKNKEANSRRTSEYDSYQRYQNMLTILEADKDKKLCGQGAGEAQYGVDPIDTAIGLWKRTSALKHERYVMDVFGDADQVPEMLGEEVIKADKEFAPFKKKSLAQLIEDDDEAKNKPLFSTLIDQDKTIKDRVAVLEHKQNVKYGDDASTSQDRFKLTKKGLSKTDFVEYWREIEPLTIELTDKDGADKNYIIIAAIYTDKQTGKNLIGFYKRDVTDELLADSNYLVNLKADERKYDRKKDSAINDTDRKAYAQKYDTHENALGNKVKTYITEDMVMKKLQAPCIVRTEDFKDEAKLARGARITPKPKS